MAGVSVTSSTAERSYEQPISMASLGGRVVGAPTEGGAAKPSTRKTMGGGYRAREPKKATRGASKSREAKI